MYLKSLFSFTALLGASSALAPTLSGGPILFGRSGAYPRATRLADNSLLGVYTFFNAGNSTLTTVRSTNNGASWEVLGQIATRETETADLDNPFVHQLPNGRILAAFRNHDRLPGQDADERLWYRIIICESTDGGRTWSFVKIAAEEPAGPNGIWEPFMETALNGDTLLYYSRLNGGADQDSILRSSNNGGRDWSAPKVISGATETARDGMLGVARIAPNSPEKLAIFESGVNGHFNIHTVRTKDDGDNWGERSLVYDAGSQYNAGNPQIVRVGSRLVASFGTNEPPNTGAWPRHATVVMVSEDQGRTWKDKVIVREAPAMWAGLITVDDSSFLALYCHPVAGDGHCYSQRLVFNSGAQADRA